MKFIVIRSNLKDGLSIVERATGESSNLPILRNILLETDNNRIKITATDLEMAISFSVLGKVIESGKFTVPADILSNLLGNIQSDRLNLEKKANKLEIKTDNYEAALQGMPANDFPITPKLKNMDEFVEIKADALKNALDQVLVASQFSNLRPELNSVLIHFPLESLKVVATDSFRLAEKVIGKDQFSSNHKQEFKLLLPLKTAQELSRILKDNDILRIYHDDNQILFKSDQLEFLSRLTEGNFPDYTAIIPKKFSAELILNRQEFVGALKLAGIFGSKSGEVKIKSQDNKKVVEVTSADQAVGENSYILPAKIQGRLDGTTFNWRYLMDVLKVIKSDEVFLGVNGEGDPAEIKSPTDASYLYILKPIAGG